MATKRVLSGVDNNVVSIVSAATWTPSGDFRANVYLVSTQAAAASISAPSGTALDGNRLIFKADDNGSAQTLTWNAVYRGIGLTLPASTVGGKIMYIGCIYNAVDGKWDVIATSTQA